MSYFRARWAEITESQPVLRYGPRRWNPAAIQRQRKPRRDSEAVAASVAQRRAEDRLKASMGAAVRRLWRRLGEVS